MAGSPPFTGVGVALVTLFDEEGEIDAPATADHAARLVDAGIAAIIVAGTTGEAAALDPDERSDLLIAVRNAVDGRVPVIAGTGAPSARQAVVLSLRAAADGADAVFVVSTPFGGDLRTEVRHAKAMIDAATDAGVDHIVYTSAANADLRTGIPHFDSKLEVEHYLIDRRPRHTIIAPAAFLDDKLGSWALDALRHGRYPVPMSGDRPLAMIAVADIGAVAAQVFADPDAFDGHRIDLAAEEITPNEMAATLADAIGKPVEHERVPIEQARRFSDDLAAMFDYFDRVGLVVDVAGLRARFPSVRWQTFGDWVRGQDWAALLG